MASNESSVRPCFDPRFFALKSTQHTNEKIELQSHPIQSTLTHVCMCGVNGMMSGEVLLKLYGLKWQTGSGGILALFFDWCERPLLYIACWKELPAQMRIQIMNSSFFES